MYPASDDELESDNENFALSDEWSSDNDSNDSMSTGDEESENDPEPVINALLLLGLRRKLVLRKFQRRALRRE